MRRIGLLQALALLSLFESCSGQATRVPDLMITSPLDGAIVQADEVLVMVDLSGLGVDANLSADLMLCLDIADKRHCFTNYQYGNKEDRVFATYLSLGETAGSYRIAAFAVCAPEMGAPANHSASNQAPLFDLLTPQESVVTIHSAGPQCTPPEPRRRVFDAFMFGTELDLLELRLRELWDVVDHFVLVEANVTHTLRPKPFVYEQHKSRFAAYASKLIHVAIESDYLEEHRGNDAWDTETLQRDTIVHALKGFGARAHDVVLISDVDEIPRPEVVRTLRDCAEAMPGGVRLHMDWYLYNGRHRHREHTWGRIGGEGPIAIEAKWLDDTYRTPTKARRHMRKGNFRAFMDMTWGVVNNAGWHFSSFGGPQAVRDKLLAYADEPFAASGFLLHPYRMERLQHFGLPYFWLRSISHASDGPFGPVTEAGPTTYPSTLGLPPITSDLHAAGNSSIGQEEEEEEDEEQEALTRLRRLFFPPLPHAQAEPSITDPHWVEQDLRAARLYMDGLDTNTPSSAISDRNMAPFYFDCMRYEEQVAAFCADHGPMCAQDMNGAIERTCRDSGTRFGRLYVDLVAPVELLPLRGADAGGQRREYIVEWREGDRPADVAQEACGFYAWGRSVEACHTYVLDLLEAVLRERGLGGYAPPADPSARLPVGTPGAHDATVDRTRVESACEPVPFQSIDDSSPLPGVEPGGMLDDEALARQAHRGGGVVGWGTAV